MIRFVVLLVVVLATAWARSPNLLLLLADDLTWTDLGCTGSRDAVTPHLDRLADEGLRFDRCYTAAPTCSPCRQSLYTGLYPVRNGAHPNHAMVYDHVVALPAHLRRLGYRVALAGKRHEAPASTFDFEQLGGFHHDSGKSPAHADLPWPAIERFLSAGDKDPWCLVVASNQPHSPWNRGDPDRFPPEQLSVPPYLVDTPALRQSLSRYFAEIGYLDDQVGRVLGLLAGAGLADDTLVLFLSEQGSELPFCKWTCYDTGIRAAAFARWPGVVGPGSRTQALVSYVDVVPTFIELAGGDPAALDLDGRSFAAVLRGETHQHHEVVFATHTARGIARGPEAYATRAATDGSWLYIRNLHPEARFRNTVIALGRNDYSQWESLDNAFARTRFLAYQVRSAEELFDLGADPWCLDNRAADEKTAADRRRLAVRLDAWMKQQGDLGDATERAAESRQPRRRPWAKGGEYER